MIIPDFSIEILYKYFTAFLLYTELHFRFKWIGSKYFKYEPEILSDLPVRIEPGKKLSILLMIKDAHQYPIHLLNIDIIQLGFHIEEYTGDRNIRHLYLDVAVVLIVQF